MRAVVLFALETLKNPKPPNRPPVWTSRLQGCLITPTGGRVVELGRPGPILWANVPVRCWKMRPLRGHVGVRRAVPRLGTIGSASPMAGAGAGAGAAQLRAEKPKSFGLIIQKASPGQ